jgi:thioredoxin-related protein
MAIPVSGYITWRLLFISLLFFSPLALADRMDSYQIGSHGQANITYPSWFKESFNDLREDLNDARESGKRGIIVFFSQKSCNHCQAFIDTTLNDPVTRERIRRQYDVIGLDIFNDIEVVDVNGTRTTIADFAENSRARLTPTLIFYGVENQALVKIVGLYPPEKFNMVLDYIEGNHFRQEKLGHYLRSRSTSAGEEAKRVEFDYELFARPPHIMDRSRLRASRPLMVLFENANCEPCTRFHERVLSDEEVRRLMSGFDAVQLDMNDEGSRIIIPDGRAMTPGQWAAELQLGYDVAVVFFDEDGEEVHRLDAETGKDRMAGSLDYVLEKAYQRHQQFLRWRRENAIKKQAS